MQRTEHTRRRRPRRRLPLRALVVAAVVAAHAALAVTPASGAVALVQNGPLVGPNGCTTVTGTFSAATTAGHLLVAVVQDVNNGCASDNFTAPAGWVRAARTCRAVTNPGPIEVWYYPNAPAGITSVVFNTGSSGANTLVQLSEWSGVALASPLDETGTSTSSSSSTTPSVTTAGTISSSGELAIAAFDLAGGSTSFTPGSGWTNLRTSAGNGINIDYRIGPPTGSSLTETITSSPQSTWGAVIATFVPACAGGSLAFKTSPTLTFSGVTLDARDQTAAQTLVVTVDDQTGSNAGWNLSATSTTLTKSSPTRTLPTTATRFTAASAAAASGNCSMPTNSKTYPITLPAGASAPAAVAVYNAAASSGAGPVDVTLTAQVSVPASAYAGTYTSTWTLTLASGP